jgi:hypothetical protein
MMIAAIAAGLVLLLTIWNLVPSRSDRIRLLQDPSARLLPAPEVIAAVFDERDYAFVVKENSKELLSLLETQRRAIARLWLASIRHEALAALREYRLSIRHKANVKASGELNVLWRAATFFLLYGFVALSVECVSVFRVRHLLKTLSSLVEPLLGYAPPAATVAS